ncbi:hypothetical protein [Myroides odoratus]|uniref:hypothetical protein n=1 Tax=Myroides odoratus TaxID=256 RepID=UPI0012E3D51C|nr:hypothetical protein [Myroides odoratus]
MKNLFAEKRLSYLSIPTNEKRCILQLLEIQNGKPVCSGGLGGSGGGSFSLFWLSTSSQVNSFTAYT